MDVSFRAALLRPHLLGYLLDRCQGRNDALVRGGKGINPRSRDKASELSSVDTAYTSTLLQRQLR